MTEETNGCSGCPMTSATEVVDRRARVASTRRLAFEKRVILTLGRGLEPSATDRRREVGVVLTEETTDYVAVSSRRFDL